MKKVLFLIVAMSLSGLVLQGATHEFQFFNTDGNTISITDQFGNTYSFNTKYQIEEGTTITFTLSDNSHCKSVAFYNKDVSGSVAEYSTTYTVTSSTPSKVWMISTDKDGSVTMWAKPAAGGYTEVTDGGMVEDPYDEDPENGRYYYFFECNYTYDVEAKPAPGYHFAYWGDDPTNTNPKRQFLAGSCTSLDVHFEPDVVEPEVVELEDNNADSYYDSFASAHAGEVDVKLVNRTFKGGMWNTVCLPFSLTQEQTESVFGTHAVANFRSATGDYTGLDIYVSYVTTGGIVAGRPYLVYPTEDIVEPVFEGVTFSTFTNSSTYSLESSDITLQGTLRPTAMEMGNLTTLCMGNNSTVYYPSVSHNIKAFRAYFVIEEEAGPMAPERARFIVMQTETPTGCSNISAENNRPRKYIQNGALIIENNGKQYNAQGKQL